MKSQGPPAGEGYRHGERRSNSVNWRIDSSCLTSRVRPARNLNPAIAVALANNEPAPGWKERQAVALGNEAPKSLWGKQHYGNAKHTQENEIPAAEIGEIALHQVEDDRADDRTFYRPDAADHDDE